MTFSTPSLLKQPLRFHIIGALLACLALALPGCSTVKLAYNNAPEISYWWLDNYLDFDAPQTLKVRAELASLQAWHRQTELPTLASTLEKLQRLAPANVTPGQLCELYSDVKPRLQALVDQLEPTLVEVAPTLQAEQLQYLEKQLDKRSQKWREEWLDGTLAERNARRVKTLVDRTEQFYGRLTEPQQDMVRASVARSIFDAAMQSRESQRRHQDTLSSLRQLQPGQPGAARVKAEVHALLSRTIASPDAAYRAYTEKLTQENCSILANLHNSSTPAQRLKLVATLKDYTTDARTLMATPR